jgi:hypothetical protein
MNPATYAPAIRRMLDTQDWEGLQNLSRAVYMLSTMEADSADRRACVAICEQLSNSEG